MDGERMTERLLIKMTPSERRIIKAAAAADKRTMGRFLVHAATVRAEAAEKRRETMRGRGGRPAA